MNLEHVILYRAAKAGNKITRRDLMRILWRQEKDDREAAVQALIEKGELTQESVINNKPGRARQMFFLTFKGANHVRKLVKEGLVDPV